MPLIHQDDFIQSIADSLQYISYYHPLDFIQALNAAYQKEQSPAAKDAMAQILINSRMCAEGHRPICQDTGIVTVVISLRKDLPCWAMPKGSLRRLVCRTLSKFTNMPCAVSGLR